MGCFPIPKNKSKVAAASQQQQYSNQYQQQLQNYIHDNGSKVEHLLSSNKPVLLPDPDDLSGEQPQGSGPLPPSAGGFGSRRKRQQQQHQQHDRHQQQDEISSSRGGKERGLSKSSSKTGERSTNSNNLRRSNNSNSSRLISLQPRAMSAPAKYPSITTTTTTSSTAAAAAPATTTTTPREDPPPQFLPIGQSASSGGPSVAFSAPRPSSLSLPRPVVDGNNGNDDGSSSPPPVFSPPSTAASYGSPSPLHCSSMAAPGCLSDGTNRSSQHRQHQQQQQQQQGLDKSVTKAFTEKKHGAGTGLFAGKPARLPMPHPAAPGAAAAAAAAHPLPLPHPSDVDENIFSPAVGRGGDTGAATGAGTGGGGGGLPTLASFVSASPARGKDGLGSVNSGSGFRSGPGGTAAAAGGGGGGGGMIPSGGEALPLPPPALPTHSRTPVLRHFSYGEVAHALVSECIVGDGVFGRAYRASVDGPVDPDHGGISGSNGQQHQYHHLHHKRKMDVAVVCPFIKALQGLGEWMAEVNWLARLQDPHLCKLIGYCVEDVPGLGSKRLLIYEFLNNGSLDQHIKGGDGRRPLDWSTRMSVALEVAQGLAYLHDKAPFQVICRDLSSLNIQLDKDLNAKLSGFGLARCGPEGEQGLTMPGPYAAPESSRNGLVTIKSNAWSFGVVLLELLTGRRHMDPDFPSGQKNLIQLTKPFLRDEGKLFLIIDPELNGRYSGRGALKVANLAFQCLMKEASLRPNLSEAVESLRTVQTDEQSLAADLKKSRSLTQSVGSPVAYHRSTSDHFVQRSFNASGSLTSSPASDPKQRGDRDFGKLAALVLGTSSPSHPESRPSFEIKPQHQRSFFNDRDAQKLPVPTSSQSIENNGHQSPSRSQSQQQRERGAPQMLGSPLHPESSSGTSSSSAGAPYGDSKQQQQQRTGGGAAGLRKGAPSAFGSGSSGPSAMDLKRPSSPVHVQSSNSNSNSSSSSSSRAGGGGIGDVRDLKRPSSPVHVQSSSSSRAGGGGVGDVKDLKRSPSSPVRGQTTTTSSSSSSRGGGGGVGAGSAADAKKLHPTGLNGFVPRGDSSKQQQQRFEGLKSQPQSLASIIYGKGPENKQLQQSSSAPEEWKLLTPPQSSSSSYSLGNATSSNGSVSGSGGEQRLTSTSNGEVSSVSSIYRPRSERRHSGELRRSDFRRNDLRLSGEFWRSSDFMSAAATTANTNTHHTNGDLKQQKQQQQQQQRNRDMKRSGELKQRNGGGGDGKPQMNHSHSSHHHDVWKSLIPPASLPLPNSGELRLLREQPRSLPNSGEMKKQSPGAAAAAAAMLPNNGEQQPTTSSLLPNSGELKQQQHQELPSPRGGGGGGKGRSSRQQRNESIKAQFVAAAAPAPHHVDEKQQQQQRDRELPQKLILIPPSHHLLNHRDDLSSSSLSDLREESVPKKSETSSGSTTTTPNTNARSSCAPSLTFDPPIIREEFCVW